MMRSSTDRRTAFVQRLRERLVLHEFTLIAADLGRTGTLALWVLTLQLPNQRVITVHAPLEHAIDPVGLGAVDPIVLRILKHFDKGLES